jgi:hypothetical protein
MGGSPLVIAAMDSVLPPFEAARFARNLWLLHNGRTQGPEYMQNTRGGTTMRRKATMLLLAAGALFAVVLAPASAQKQTLRMAYWAGPAHQMVQTQEAWIKTIEATSSGNLTVVVMAASAKPEGQYDLIKNGVRDLVWAVPSYTHGRFEMLQVTELPFLCPSPAGRFWCT